MTFGIGSLPLKQQLQLHPHATDARVCKISAASERASASGRLPAGGDAVPFVLIIGSHWTVYQVTIAVR